MLLSSGGSPLGLNESGLVAVGSYSWNSNTLAWEKSTSGVGPAATVSVSNFPATQVISGTVQPGNTANTTPWRVDMLRAQTVLFATISASASGANTIVAASGSNKIKVLNSVIIADAAVTVTLKSASTALSGAMSLAANGGVASPVGTPGGGWIMETAINEALVLTLSSAVGVRGHVSYFLES